MRERGSNRREQAIDGSGREECPERDTGAASTGVFESPGLYTTLGRAAKVSLSSDHSHMAVVEAIN